ncbi:hypothetical protein EYZ11_006590 [Aspergillus tanneri]|uniref:Uncharacterized protein n=1 Tax=Aspergillus tanneri TaxID=1220188 RepID=A0A4S3JF42_9EURO|nr:hypothetical protein EYZ11_006590 [Aspergillus tanneri]
MSPIPSTDGQQQTHTKAVNLTRIPAAGLKEMTSALTNSRSGIVPPGTIANKTSSVPRPELQHQQYHALAPSPENLMFGRILLHRLP